MFNNEEELRTKLIIPFLKDLGFEESEITLEDTFRIRLGHNEKIISGRSDILCKRQGKNLFVLELKIDSHEINQNDIRQGISYSRALIGNIAPFTIITNGKETKIYDTISEKELNGTKLSMQADFWKNGCILSTDQEISIRYEALKNFISFSDDNLMAFCTDQVRSRIKPISGEITSSAKYLESLYFHRQDLNSEFNKFIESEGSVFGLVGIAGVGKTSSMCSLALHASRSNFVLFYNASLLGDSILDTIALDLSLVFSSKNEKNIVLKKLEELGRFINKKILIFIDGIDECINNNLKNEISELSYSVGKLDYIKLCVSCKSSIWSKFLRTNDTTNHIYEELIKFHNISQELKDPGYNLKEFNDIEIEKVLPAYQKAYNFSGELTDELKQQVKNGFFLRIFSEVYINKDVPNEINDIELIKLYLVQSLSKTPLGVQRGLRILSKIGKTFIEYNYTDLKYFKQDGIEIDRIIEDLDLAIDQELPQVLFDRNILVKSNSLDKDKYFINFYYSKIRDYIICYHSYNLDNIDDKKFYNYLEIFYENNIGESALDLYLNNANYSKINIVRNFKNDKSYNYALLYDEFLETNFKKIKKEFDPKTEGKVGIIIPKDSIKFDGYALIPLDSNSNEILQFDGFDQPLSTPVNDIRIFRKGATRYHSSNSTIMVADQMEVIKKNVYSELKKIIEEGLLYEYDSEVILKEKVITILYFYYKKLNFKFKLEDKYMPRFDQLYPIDLRILRDSLYRFRAEHFYRREKIEDILIGPLVDKALKMNNEIPRLNVVGDFPPFEELFKIVSLLISNGHERLDSHNLPGPDIPLDIVKSETESNRDFRIDDIRRSQFSSNQVRIYINEFFKELESAYKQIVESCFPTFTNDLDFYKSMPYEYTFYLDESNNSYFGVYGYKKSSTNFISINFKPKNNSNSAFEFDGLRILRGFDFDSIIYSKNSSQTVRKINTRDVDKYCVLRDWVYRLLTEDFNKLFKRYNIQIHRPQRY